MAYRRRTKERRQSMRLSLAIPIFTRGLDEREREFLEFTTTVNISAGGALLAIRRHMPPDSEVTLEIPAAPLPRLSTHPNLVRTLQARVVRVIPSEPSYLCAVSFHQPLI